MPANILDGNQIAQQQLHALQKIIKGWREQAYRQPSLAVIIVGNIPASLVYIKYKIAACHLLGIKSHKIAFPETVSESELTEEIIKLNDSVDIDGILVQLPLPQHISTSKIMGLINLGYLASNLPGLRPCTPQGIMHLLEHTGVDLIGKHAVILGSSLIVGKPMALELMARRATVTICNSKTQKIQEHLAQADILIVAIGKAEFVDGRWCKPNGIIIDVGINRKSDGKLCGDVNFATAVNVAKWLTPVPGGVGPMTVASLMENTVLAYKMRNGL